MEELIEKLTFYKSSGYMKSTSMEPALAEALLDSHGSLDVIFLRESMGLPISAKQVEKAYMKVFDAQFLPKKFSYVPTKSTITKEEFLETVYKPAQYLNVRDFIEDVLVFKNLVLTKKDLFTWILSTSKPKVFLGDLND